MLIGRILRRALCVFGLLAVLAAPLAAAEDEASPPPVADLELLAAALEDPARRERILTALRAALDDGPKKSGETPDAQQQAAAGVERAAGAAARALEGIAALPRWMHQQFTVSARRDFWLGTGLVGIALPFVIALLARGLVRAFMKTILLRLREEPAANLRRRVLRGLVHGGLDALQVPALLAAGLVAVSVFERSFASAAVAEFMIRAAALHAAVDVLARMVLAPDAPHLRPVAIATAGAELLHRWIVRVSLTVITGYVVVTMAVPLGASLEAAEGIAITVALAFACGALLVVWRARRAVTAWMRGDGDSIARRGLADIWYMFAILYVLLLFGAFVTGERAGVLWLTRATAVTAAALVAATLLSHLAGRAIRALFSFSPDVETRFPGLRERSAHYHRLLHLIARILFYGTALLLVLQAWNIDLPGLVEPEFRTVLVKNGLVIVLVVVLGLVGWEMSSSALARLLADDQGSRARTLLPLLRRVLVIALLAIGGLMILSALGVDTAPLLAGAGVFGLAIGFGSQALVRDFISGLFILIEDSISIGDVVTIGGHTGIVEDLSIRTVRLRDLSGTVHVVPFGDVTSIENFTREFSFAVMDIGVAYREDTDLVCAALDEVGAELCEDPEWSEQILEPLQILGVDQLADSAVVIRCRLKTVAMQQWGVRRAFLRLVKKRFDEKGIEIPFPHSTVYFGVDRDGDAPAGRIRLVPEAHDRE